MEVVFPSHPTQVLSTKVLYLNNTYFSLWLLFQFSDPYNWTGTNAVFSGLKKWKLYPPGQDHLLYVKENSMAGFPLNTYKYNR